MKYPSVVTDEAYLTSPRRIGDVRLRYSQHEGRVRNLVLEITSFQREANPTVVHSLHLRGEYELPEFLRVVDAIHALAQHPILGIQLDPTDEAGEDRVRIAFWSAQNKVQADLSLSSLRVRVLITTPQSRIFHRAEFTDVEEAHVCIQLHAGDLSSIHPALPSMAI